MAKINVPVNERNIPLINITIILFSIKFDKLFNSIFISWRCLNKYIKNDLSDN